MTARPTLRGNQPGRTGLSRPGDGRIRNSWLPAGTYVGGLGERDAFPCGSWYASLSSCHGLFLPSNLAGGFARRLFPVLHRRWRTAPCRAAAIGGSRLNARPRAGSRQPHSCENFSQACPSLRFAHGSRLSHHFVDAPKMVGRNPITSATSNCDARSKPPSTARRVAESKHAPVVVTDNRSFRWNDAYLGEPQS